MALASKYESWKATRRSLLSRLKNWDDHDSWRQFFDIYSSLVYAVALKAGLSAIEAEEVVQETFITLAKQLRDGKYDRAKGSFKGWLLGNTRWRIDEQFRKRKHQGPARASTRSEQRTPTVERIPDPASLNIDTLYEEEWRKNLFTAAVERVRQQVSAKQFQIFDLCVLRKWPARKVAETLGTNAARIYLAKHRVLQVVKKECKALETESI